MIWHDRALLARVVALTVAAATAVVTIAIVRGEPSETLAGDSALALSAEVAAGLLLVAAAFAARAPTELRALLAAAGIAWLAAEWNNPGAGAAFTAGLVLYAAWPPLLAHAALRYGERPLGRPAIALLAVAYADTLLFLGAGSAFFFDPRAQGCFDCPANRLLVSAQPDLVHDLGRAGLWIAAAWSLGVRHARCRPPRSRHIRRAGGSSSPSCFPQPLRSRCLVRARCTAPSAASCRTTRPTARCGSRSSLRWRSVAAGVAWARVRARRTRDRARAARGRAWPVAAGGRVGRPARRSVRRPIAPAPACSR